VFLRELWPAQDELAEAVRAAEQPQVHLRMYQDLDRAHPLWSAIVAPTGALATWKPSTYITRPPFLDEDERLPSPLSPVRAARALVLLGDSVTTDHISPAGAIDPDSPAGEWLQLAGVPESRFNSYGSRRGHHEVMVRATFANVRLRNRMLPPDADGQPAEGGYTLLQPQGRRCSIFEAAATYRLAGVPMLVIAGLDYGSGSSRDWAAKGTRLLGVRAVLARSFERIHRANLVGMGVLPLQFGEHDSAQSLGLRGDELFDLQGMGASLRPGQTVMLRVTHADGRHSHCMLRLRLDTPMEVTLLSHGGILPHVLGELLGAPVAETLQS
jgi:aconitate hydratase